MNSDENDDVFPEADEDFNKSFSDEGSDEEDDNVPDWAKSKSFDPDDNIRRRRRAASSMDNSELVALEERHEEDMRTQREVNRKYCDRLKRRADLIVELRNAYLRDIITLKHVINEQLSKDERVEVQAVWKRSIPSIDIRQHLMLYGPKEASFDVIPCETCGGSVELVHHDSSEIEELSKALSHMDKNKDDLRLLIATKGAQLEHIQVKMDQMERTHKEEKKVMFSEMRSSKSKSEDIHRENIQLSNQVRMQREHLAELRVKEEQFDKVSASLTATSELLHEANMNIKNMEDSSAKSRENIAGLTDQLATCTAEKDMAESDVLTQAAHIKSITNISGKHKTNSETLSKTVEKLEKLQDRARRDMEALNGKVNDLEMNLSQQSEEMTREIESLEGMLDTAREEAAVLNEELREVQHALTAKTSEKDGLQNSYNELHFAKEEAVASLEQQVATLKQRTQKAEEELHMKTSTYDSVLADMKKYKESSAKFEVEAKHASSLQKDFDKMKKEFDKMTEADKERRRKVREEKKQEAEQERQRLETLAARSPTKSPGHNDSSGGAGGGGRKDPSPKKIKDKMRRDLTQKALEASTEEGQEGGQQEQVKYVPHKRQRGKCRSSPLSRSNTSNSTGSAHVISAEGDGRSTNSARTQSPDRIPVAVVEAMQLDSSAGEDEFVDAAGGSSRPPTQQNRHQNQQGQEQGEQDQRGEHIAPLAGVTPKSTSFGPLPRGSSRDIYSSDSFEFFSNRRVRGGAGGLSPALNFLLDPPQQQSSLLPLLSFVEGEEPAERGEGVVSVRPGSADVSLSSVHHYDFGTHQHVSHRLQKACKKLINQQELADDVGLTADFAANVLRVVARLDNGNEEGSVISMLSVDVDDDHNHSHRSDHDDNDDLNDMVAQNRDIQHQHSDEQSLCSDINCEHHDLDTELHNETAKIFGMTLRDSHYLLQSKLSVKDSQVALDLLAPQLLQLASITAKAQIGLWKAMRSTKRQTDFICKVGATCQKMMPFWGSDSRGMDADDLAHLQARLSDDEYFDQFREKWLSAVRTDLDANMMLKLTEKEWNEHISLFVDLPSSSHFDYDEEREDAFDSALNSMFVMETFTDKMSGGVDSLLTSFFLDWAMVKMHLLEGGGGSASEAELQRVTTELTTANTELDVLRLQRDNLTSSHTALLDRVTLLEPDALRCQELTVEKDELTANLQALNNKFVNLTNTHKSLTLSNTKLAVDHKAATGLIQQLRAELSAGEKAMAAVQAELDARLAIQQAMTDELEAARDKERVRLFELVSSAMQTEPFVNDVSCQTDFIVPPMSLHHTMSSSIGRGVPASAKRSFYPVVTAGGPSKGFAASLHDEFDFSVGHSSGGHSQSQSHDRDIDRDRGVDRGRERGDSCSLDQASAFSLMTSSMLDDGTHMSSSSIIDGTEFLEERSVLTPILMHHERDLFSAGSSRPGSRSGSKRGFSESLRMLNKLSAAQHQPQQGGGSEGPQPLSGKLSPIKYVKQSSGPVWVRSDTTRMRARSISGDRASSSHSISSLLEGHRRNQAPPHRQSVDMHSTR